MATIFQREETIICTLNVTNSAGTAIDPDTSIKVKIKANGKNVKLNDSNMSKSAVGVYYYDYTPPASAELGEYDVWYYTVNSGRTTILKDSFKLQK